MLEVTQDDIGFELATGKFEVLISEFTILPEHNKGQRYKLPTGENGSPIIRVFRRKDGLDSDIAEDHTLVGEFEVGELQPNGETEPEIAILFKMPVGDILSVEAWKESISKPKKVQKKFQLETPDYSSYTHGI